MTIKTNKIPMPGLFWGMYPEQKERYDAHETGFVSTLTQSVLNRLNLFDSVQEKRFISAVRAQEKIVGAHHTELFNLQLYQTQIALKKNGFTNILTARAFALISSAYVSTLSIKLFDAQIIAAYHMLNGRLAEMATGEGKTYAVALAAATAALAGAPVQIITANDYLAQRDAETLKTFYNALGISVDAAIQGQDSAHRAAAYACDATYCTAKELVFDYLRDGVQRNNQTTHSAQTSELLAQPLFLRGLCMAIIDEADSILIDEARVPLILSQAANNDQELQYLSESLTLAKQLNAKLDYKLNTETLQVNLTTTGRENLELKADSLPAIWHNRLHREEVICQALAALYLYQRDHHYIVENEKVLIVDETTGRVAEGRTWSQGLHQLIELKENCDTSPTLATMSQITYQRFFPRYLRLGGVSGTLIESRTELLRVYGLKVSKVALRSPNKRKLLPTRLFKDHAVLRDALIVRIRQIQSAGQPVLIGTESVSESEKLSNMLLKEKMAHIVLNARNDQNEADAIAKAGQTGAITVTTNTAGRGTDISLADGIDAKGGLHVISCQLNNARRIDRQLAGRGARQGDHGSVETWISLDTPLLKNSLPKWLKLIVKKYTEIFPSQLIDATISLIQRTEEKRHMRLRKYLLFNDKNMAKNLTFGNKHD